VGQVFIGALTATSFEVWTTGTPSADSSFGFRLFFLLVRFQRCRDMCVKGFVIAGPASGEGKTTVMVALMAALRARGLQVQPFKCGPDFIDGGYHRQVCGRPSRNLDGWMVSASVNKQIFDRHAEASDVCVVEGMMGLFDGVGGSSERGSTAEMAKLLGLPVVLVVDASATARSVAALIYGFENFDPALKVAGVIFNKVGGQVHYQLLCESVLGKCRSPVLGFLPEDPQVSIPERHLGLVTAGEHCLSNFAVERLAAWATTHVDLTRLLLRAATLTPSPPNWQPHEQCEPVWIAVARDQAFCFYYEDNLDALRRAGAEIVEFSPLTDSELPPHAHALYFGGGYPELYAAQLAANRSMLTAVRQFAEQEGPIYAECGGFMYLSQELAGVNGETCPMAGVLPMRVSMAQRPVNFGYAEVTLSNQTIWGHSGATARGHSFHWSTVTSEHSVGHAYRVRYSLTGRLESEGFSRSRVLGSYIHLHFLSNSQTAPAFVESARSFRTLKQRTGCKGAP
jgi:cobyrinic acid a,c-diamide synthase